jgi:hypothetical protein
MRERPMRLTEAHLCEQGARLLPSLGQELHEAVRDLGAPPGPVNLIVPAPLGVSGFVLRAEEMRLVASTAEDLGEMPLVRMQVIREPSVREADDPIGVRESPGPECRAGRTALRRGAERVGEPNSCLGESVDIRRADVLRSVAPEMLPQVVADDDDDIRPVGLHRVPLRLQM